MNNRFKTYGLWLAMFSLFGLILRDMELLPPSYGEYVEIIMYILVAAGVIINPSIGTGYSDDKTLIKGEFNNDNY